MSSESLNGILITGSSGQVGGELVRAFTPHAQRFGLVHAPLRADLNLSDPDSIRRAVRALNFGLPRTLSATAGTCTHLSPRLAWGRILPRGSVAQSRVGALVAILRMQITQFPSLVCHHPEHLQAQALVIQLSVRAFDSRSSPPVTLAR